MMNRLLMLERAFWRGKLNSALPPGLIRRRVVKRWLIALIALEAALIPLLCHRLHTLYTYYYAYYLALLTAEHEARLQLMELKYAGISLGPVTLIVAALCSLGMVFSIARPRLRDLILTPVSPLESVGRHLGLWWILTAVFYALLFGIYELSCAAVRWHLDLDYPWHPLLPLARMCVVNTMVVWLLFPLALAAALARSLPGRSLGTAAWLMALLLVLQTEPLIRLADTGTAVLVLILLGILHPFFLLLLDHMIGREKTPGKAAGVA